MKKSFILPALLFTICMLFVSCGESVPHETQTRETKPETIETTKEVVSFIDTTYSAGETVALSRLLGRAYMKGEALVCNPAAAGLEFEAVCKGDIKLNVTASGDRIITVVDGVKTEHIKLDGTTTYTVAKNLPEGLHTVRIVNESGFISINSVTVTGKLTGSEESRVYVEIIGDSVSEGAGLYDGAGNCATKAFGYLAMEALGLDYSYCARGGTALAYAGENNYVMEDLYVLQDQKLKEASPAYVPAKTPDLIIIELTQNDDWQWFSGTVLPDGTNGTVPNKNATNGYYTIEKFDAAFERLIQLVYGTYKKDDIPILFVFGCMTNPSASVGSTRAKQLVKEYAEMGYPFKSVILSTDRTGLASHPTEAGAARQGKELTDFLVKEYPEFDFAIQEEIEIPEVQTTETVVHTRPEEVVSTGKLSLDFNTTDSFENYIAKSGNGIWLPSEKKKAEIRDNTYYNPGVECFFEDLTCMMFGGLDTGKPFSYTIEFELMFEAYASTPNNTILNIHGYKDDATIANWNKLLSVDPDGSLHANTDVAGNVECAVKTEPGKWYHIRIVVDAATKTASLWIDDAACGAIKFNLTTTSGRCGFRLGNGGGSKFYVDDFTVTKD